MTMKSFRSLCDYQLEVGGGARSPQATWGCGLVVRGPSYKLTKVKQREAGVNEESAL